MDFDMSPEVGALAEAMAAVQGKLEGAKKASENPAFKAGGKVSKYADLASVWDAARDLLSANNVAVIQSPGQCIENRMWMTTVLFHGSGQWMRGTLSIPLGKVDAHGYGSATTYARRYALAAMVGISPEDDDGNAATKPNKDAVENDGQRSILNPKPGEQRQRPQPLTMKHKTREAAKKAYGEIVKEMEACGSDGDLLETTLLNYEDDFEQFREELPAVWFGDGGDFLGMAKEIEAARSRVVNWTVE